jgi:predicted MFS family arabinose efflux permease
MHEYTFIHRWANAPTPTTYLFSCTRAATEIEYAFIASLISIAIYAGASTIGPINQRIQHRRLKLLTT